MGLNGAGKTSLMRILAGHTTADAGTVELGHKVSVGYYAQEHEGITAGREVLGHLTGTGRSPAAAAAQPARHVRPLRRRRVPGRGHALRGREDEARARAARRREAQPAPARRADEQPRSTVARRDRRALRVWPGAIILVSHDAEFVASLEPQRVLLMPDGDLDYWTDDLLDLVALCPEDLRRPNGRTAIAGRPPAASEDLRRPNGRPRRAGRLPAVWGQGWVVVVVDVVDEVERRGRARGRRRRARRRGASSWSSIPAGGSSSWSARSSWSRGGWSSSSSDVVAVSSAVMAAAATPRHRRQAAVRARSARRGRQLMRAPSP